jgi:hypothetical protein
MPMSRSATVLVSATNCVTVNRVNHSGYAPPTPVSASRLQSGLQGTQIWKSPDLSQRLSLLVSFRQLSTIALSITTRGA